MKTRDKTASDEEKDERDKQSEDDNESDCDSEEENDNRSKDGQSSDDDNNTTDNDDGEKTNAENDDRSMEDNNKEKDNDEEDDNDEEEEMDEDTNIKRQLFVEEKVQQEKAINQLIKECGEESTEEENETNKRQKTILQLLKTYIAGNNEINRTHFMLENTNIKQNQAYNNIIQTLSKGKRTRNTTKM